MPGAACLSGSSVGAVAPTVGGHNVGERIVEAFGFGVYAIAERQPVLGGIHQNAFDGSQRDVKHIVYRSTSVGIASRVAGDEAEPQLTAHRVAGMPVLSRRRSATGPASFGPHPGQMGECRQISGARADRLLCISEGVREAMFAHIHQCRVNQRICGSEVLRRQSERLMERLLGKVVKSNVAGLSGLLKKGGS